MYSWDSVKPVNIGPWTANWTNYFREGLDKNGNVVGNPTVHSMSLGGYALSGPANVPDAHPDPKTECIALESETIWES